MSVAFMVVIGAASSGCLWKWRHLSGRLVFRHGVDGVKFLDTGVAVAVATDGGGGGDCCSLWSLVPDCC